MIFFITPKRKHILRYYWRTHKPFTAEDLFTAGLTRSVHQGDILIHRMEQNHQIIRFPSAEGNYIGTTESEKEWKNLKCEAKSIHANPFSMDEAMMFRGLNYYESRGLLHELTAMIEKKREEILDRENRGQHHL